MTEKNKENLLYNCNKLSLSYFDVLMKENVWKAFTTIHAGIHHQMRIVLQYYFSKRMPWISEYHQQRWDIIGNKKFYTLISDLFVTGIINPELKKQLEHFNTHRNKELGHVDVYQKNEISDQDVKNLCLEGIQLIKQLDIIIHSIFFPRKEEN